jgi:hypothetical protein
MDMEDIKDDIKKKPGKKKKTKSKSEAAANGNLSIIAPDKKEILDNKAPKVPKSSEELKSSKSSIKSSKKKITSTPKKKKRVEDDIKVDSIEIPVQTVKLTMDKISKMIDELIEETESQPMGQVEDSNEIAEEIASNINEDKQNQNNEISQVLPEIPDAILESADLTFSESSKVEIAQEVVLPLTAIKIRNIVGKTNNLTVEIIPNKVIVQGVVHNQIFFVGNDGIVHHQASDENFSTFLDIPGVEPGMNGYVTASIEDTISELASNGGSFLLKTVLEVFVKVTNTIQINVSAGNGPTLYLNQVVGENSAQTLVEADLSLTTPAIKIDEIVGSIRDLTIETIRDKVIIQGILHKQIFFVDTANIGRHQAEDTPFSFFVDIPGATPGMNVIVQPRIEGIFYNLISTTLLQNKAVIEFFVKVTENVLLPVAVGTGPLLKVNEFIGENTVQELTETLIALNNPAIKVREVLASLRDLVSHVTPNKVIVQGILHKQIFYIGTDNIEYHQAEDVPFSVFLDINGIAPGNDVILKPTIEGIFFDLVSTTQLRQKVIFAIHAVVTEQVQLNSVIGVGPLFAVEQVIGENTKQLLVIAEQVIVPPVPPFPSSNTPVVTQAIIDPQINEILGSQQIILQSSVPLPMTAIKVKEVHASVSNISNHVIPEGVVIEGIINLTTTYVGNDNIVRTINTAETFSILVNIPGVTSNQITNTAVNIEDIIFNLDPAGNRVDLTIVLQGVVNGFIVQGERFTAVTDVSGTGISQNKVAVIANVFTPTGDHIEEINLVTDVSGPGITDVTKQTVLVRKVGEQVFRPTTVVTNVKTITVIEPGF